jgi:hypothetical protein
MEPPRLGIKRILASLAAVGDQLAKRAVARYWN